MSPELIAGYVATEAGRATATTPQSQRLVEVLNHTAAAESAGFQSAVTVIIPAIGANVSSITRGMMTY